MGGVLRPALPGIAYVRDRSFCEWASDLAEFDSYLAGIAMSALIAVRDELVAPA